MAYMSQLKGKSKINVVALERKGYCLAEFDSIAVTETYPWKILDHKCFYILKRWLIGNTVKICNKSYIAR